MADLTLLLEQASRLLQAGDTAAAIAAYERLLTTWPGQRDAWYNLGYLRHRSNEFEAALRAYEEALRLGVEQPEEVHLNRAVILADHLGRYADAEREIRRSIDIRPDYTPAWLNLATLGEQVGEREMAQQAYEQVLAREPDHALALGRLPNLLPEVDPADPLLDRLRRRLRREGTPPAERAELAFGLGKALDRAGLFDEAFAVYTLANRASRESAGGCRYDAAAHERRVDSLIEASMLPQPAATTTAETPRMIFICGMFRSGSTLVEQILASHPDVTAGGELPLLPEIARREMLAASGPSPGRGGTPAEVLREAYLAEVRRMFPGAGVVTDKRPDNFLHVGLIKRLFPEATIIHTLRDPVDNCLSVFFLHLDHGMPYALDLADTAHWYGQYRRLMRHWKKLYGAAIVDIEYETLVDRPREVISGLLERCGLRWADACLSFHQSRVVVKTPSAWQVRQPLYRHSTGRWRNYERHLGPLRAALDRWLASPRAADTTAS